MTEWNQQEPINWHDEPVVGKRERRRASKRASKRDLYEAILCFGGAVLSACLTILSLFIWGIAQSSVLHEGGDPSEVKSPLVMAIVFFVLAIALVIFGLRITGRDAR